MRLLFLLDNFSDDDAAGGMLLRLCRRMVAVRELTLSCTALGADGPMGERLTALGVHTRALGLGGWRDWKKFKEAGRKALYRADRPDVVHSFCRWPDLGARFFHGGREDVPLVTTVIDMGFCSRGTGSSTPCVHDNLPWRLAERWTRRHMGMVVASCEGVRRGLIARGIPPVRLRHVPLGVDGVTSYPVSPATADRFRSLLGVTAETPLLLCATRLEEHIGLETVIDAMPAILAAHGEARLFIVGDGPAREAIERRIANLGLQESVTIIGHLSSVLARLYSTADVVIHVGPPLAFSAAAAECMAAGSPVVAARVGGIPEQVVHEETGLLYDPGDAKGLASAVKVLVEDRELRDGMGQLAREHALQHHEITATTEQYVQLWRDMAPAALWETTTSLHIEELQEMKREALGS